MSAGLTLTLPTNLVGHGPSSMDHPQSPLGPRMTQMHDGHNPSSPEHHHHNMGGHHHPDPSVSMGYRGAPPPGAYGAPPPNYPPYSPYGPPQGGYGGAPPPHGYPPHGGHAPPGSYPPPPHAHTSYPGYGYPPGRAPYGYGYEGGYPAQQARKGPPYNRGPHAPPARQVPPPQQAQQRHPSPQKGSPTSMGGKTSPQRSMDAPMRPPKLADHVEVERLRAAAATEISHAEVKPIRTDFHFFVQTHKDKYLALAKDEVRRSLKEGEKLDPFLVNTNLNTRLMKAWEDLAKDQRDEYMVREEEDRRRFMEEDEIASRHCATLTARGKSPRASEKEKSKREEQREESETPPATTPDRESPSRKVVVKEEDDVDEEEEEHESEGLAREEGAHGIREDDDSATHEVGSPKKRMSPPTHADGSTGDEPTHESPPKRNRVQAETSSAV